VIESEMVHEARIVPLDRASHVSPRVRSWTGDSQGHWEGNTLVVDTTNYRDRGWLFTVSAAGRLKGVPHSAALHLVERFTLKGLNTLEFRMTVNDPEVFTAPWTAVTEFKRSADYRIFDYDCHEGNLDLELTLRGARAEENASHTPR
jgi:hypothetical protein